MPSPSVLSPVQRLWALEKSAYGLRVLLALSAVMAGSWAIGEIGHVIPLFLGIIAAALAETDDHWRGRITASLVTLVLFAATAFIVQMLMAYPALFATAIVGSTFCLTMGGALGTRYATIGHATLTLGVYTMLGLEQTPPSAETPWQLPMLLTVGAAWYCLLSVVWQAVWADHPVRQGLAALFETLGDYLEGKSQLFLPVHHADIAASRVALAQRNGRVVIALNLVKELIRRRRRRGGPDLDRHLHRFFLAQDIHERASSSHYPYEFFIEAFFHSDVMFRCQRALFQQGRACRSLAKALRQRASFNYADSGQAMADLRASLAHLKAGKTVENAEALRSLGHLVGNLEALEQELEQANDDTRPTRAHDDSLFDERPRSLRDACGRIRQNLSATSPIFRHALRLSLALGAGYALKSFIHPAFGFWILLTTLFVCLPNYASTRRRLLDRIAGTVLGLVAGWALITLFPEASIQRLIAVAAGVAFFLWRTNRYILATGAITLMVMCCFNQVVDGYDIIWPRLIDTLLGGALSALAVVLVLPDWQGRQLHKVVAATLSASGTYLREVMRQYAQGKADDLAYRIARRAAHAADAALSTDLSNMLREPGRYRAQAERSLRILVLSHTVLGHLSALGAHREDEPLPVSADVSTAADYIVTALEEMAHDLSNQRILGDNTAADLEMATKLETTATDCDERERLLRTQLALICRQLPQIRQQLDTLPGRPVTVAVA